MTDCLDSDILTAVGQALDWDVDEPLDHLGTCQSCRATLATLAATRNTLARQVAVDPKLVDRIMTQLPVNRTEGPGSARAWKPVMVFNAGMVMITTMAVAVMAAAQTSGPLPGWPVAAAGLVSAVGYLSWQRRPGVVNNE
jgi:anti-sigma factor RsiW